MLVARVVKANGWNKVPVVEAGVRLNTVTTSPVPVALMLVTFTPPVRFGDRTVIVDEKLFVELGAKVTSTLDAWSAGIVSETGETEKLVSELMMFVTIMAPLPLFVMTSGNESGCPLTPTTPKLRLLSNPMMTVALMDMGNGADQVETTFVLIWLQAMARTLYVLATAQACVVEVAVIHDDVEPSPQSKLYWTAVPQLSVETSDIEFVNNWPTRPLLIAPVTAG